MQIQQPKTKSDFEKYFEFRWRMLRKPWQQDPGSEQDELEHESFHVMAVDNDNSVIAVGRIHFINDTASQIRYMAVAEHKQNQYLGTAILKALEQFATKHNKRTIILHARENALGFYEKHGYRIIQQSHVLYECIQHFEMQKDLPL